MVWHGMVLHGSAEKTYCTQQLSENYGLNLDVIRKQRSALQESKGQHHTSATQSGTHVFPQHDESRTTNAGTLHTTHSDDESTSSHARSTTDSPFARDTDPYAGLSAELLLDLLVVMKCVSSIPAQWVAAARLATSTAAAPSPVSALRKNQGTRTKKLAPNGAQSTYVFKCVQLACSTEPRSLHVELNYTWRLR
jgi:hypothetical protein